MNHVWTPAFDRQFVGRQAALKRLARLLQPHLERLDAAFRRGLSRHGGRYGPKAIRALGQITIGAAAAVVGTGRPVADFFEQVEYNGRRLAKLSLLPSQVLRAMGQYDRLLDPLLAGEFQEIRAQLRAAVIHTLNNAYYRVRQEEAQAFFDLFRAELDARGLDDLLERFAEILRRTFRAQAGKLYLFSDRPPAALTRRRFIEAADQAEELILDPGMRGRYASYWSIPFFAGRKPAGVVQLGFAKRYEWLPRELELLAAVVERCLAAAEKARLSQELAQLAAHMFQVEEEERRRISRELHDEAGQSLLAIRLQLELLEKASAAEWKRVRSKLAQTRCVVEQTILEIRRIIAALSPAALEQLGLPAAIRQLTARFRKVCPAEVRLRLAPLGRLPGNVETIAYRLVQECYHNIAKHSRAAHVKVCLGSTDGCLELRVEDDGVGFDLETAGQKRDSYGLAGMRERVALLGGSFQIRSKTGKGTSVTIALPLGEEKHGQDSRTDHR